MLRVTVFAFSIFCALVAVTVPLPQNSSSNSILSNKQGRATDSREHQVKNVILLRHLSTLYTRNFFADIIRSILGMSVKELLIKLETTFKDLDQVTNQGVVELNNVLNIASPEIRAELIAIRNNAIDKVFEIVGEHLKDLAKVLPALSIHAMAYDPSSDIIYALLGKTLEELVTEIAVALQQSLQLLNNTIVSFQDLAKKATPQVRDTLNRIANVHMDQGRAIIIPMLDQLRQIVFIASTSTIKGMQSQHSKDLLDAIISTMLGINILSVAKEADNVHSQLIPLLETTREELDEALEHGAGENGTKRSEVLVQVMEIFDNAMDDVIRDTKPIFSVLQHFEEKSRRETTFVYDMSSSLLGIGVDAFKIYIENTTSRVETTMKHASSQIISASAKEGIPSLIKVSKILFARLRLAKRISKSLLESLKSILNHPTVEMRDDANIDTTVEEGAWLEDNGSLYNRDILLNAASQLLGFEVEEATKRLKASLEQLDELMESALLELQGILVKVESQDIRMDILGIMNDTLTNIHITLQPMLDVLLPFLPDEIRQNKQVAVDIYTGTNGVNMDLFLRYCSMVTRKIPEITDIAMIRIKTRAARAGPTVHGKLDALLRIIDAQTRAIIQPFIDIVGPIISPH